MPLSRWPRAGRAPMGHGEQGEPMSPRMTKAERARYNDPRYGSNDHGPIMPTASPTLTQEPANAVEPTEMTFTLPLPPNIANARMHWRVKNIERKAYMQACDALQAAGRVPAPPRQPFVRSWIEASITNAALSDDDNAMARLKWPVDWLKTRGYIVDDSRKHLTWRGLPDQHITRKDAPHVVITLDPITTEAT